MNALYHAHSGIRYLVLLAAVAAIVVLAVGLATDRRLGATRAVTAAFTGLLDLQVLLGLALVMGGMLTDRATGHLIMMVLALVVAHAASIIAGKRRTIGASSPCASSESCSHSRSSSAASWPLGGPSLAHCRRAWADFFSRRVGGTVAPSLEAVTNGWLRLQRPRLRSYLLTMAHREIVDARGVLWEVWDVHPTLAERRVQADRRAQRRATPDRRRQSQARAALATELRQGWLTFQSRTERRRCAPIPSSWDGMDDVQLLDILGSAQQSARPRRLIE